MRNPSPSAPHFGVGPAYQQGGGKQAEKTGDTINALILV